MWTQILRRQNQPIAKRWFYSGSLGRVAPALSRFAKVSFLFFSPFFGWFATNVTRNWFGWKRKRFSVFVSIQNEKIWTICVLPHQRVESVVHRQRKMPTHWTTRASQSHSSNELPRHKLWAGISLPRHRQLHWGGEGSGVPHRHLWDTTWYSAPPPPRRWN